MTREVASDVTTQAPIFNFFRYEQGATYYNTGNRIDFVTDENSLYVCAVETLTTTAEHIEDQPNLLKIVSKGADGRPGATGEQGIPGRSPKITAKFEGNQVSLYSEGVRIATTTDLTPPSWRPYVVNNTIAWERTKSNTAPAPIDLNDLKAKDYKPLILRVDTDNTKRSDEESGEANYIQWKREGDEEWHNLIHLSDLLNLALAGVSIWEDPEDGYFHFGHRKVVHASYDIDDQGHRTISDVELGEVLFDAGPLPFQSYELDFDDVTNRLDAIEQRLRNLNLNFLTLEDAEQRYIKEIRTIDGNSLRGTGDLAARTINGVHLFGDYSNIQVGTIRSLTVDGVLKDPDSNGNISFNTGGNIDLSGYAHDSEVVKSVTINGERKTPTNGNVSFTISVGSNGILNIKIENGHLWKQDSDGWHDLGAITDGNPSNPDTTDLTQLKLRVGDPNDSSKRNHLYISYDNGVTWQDLGEFVDTVANVDLTGYATWEGLGDLYYTQLQCDNLFVKKSDLTGGVEYYRTFTIYKRTDSNTTIPAVPLANVNATWDVEHGVLDLPSGYTEWKNHPDNATAATPYLWMTSATFRSSDGRMVDSTWETPICLTGVDGRDGEDGRYREFVYIRTDGSIPTLTETIGVYPVGENSSHVTTYLPDSGPNAKNHKDFLPGTTTMDPVPFTPEQNPSTLAQISWGGWLDNPQGVTEQLTHEWVSFRTISYENGNDSPTFSAFSNPVIWSMWGEDGIDGDGVEYIFAVATAADTVVNSTTGKRELNASFFRGQNANQILPLIDSEVELLGSAYQEDDWVPDGQNGRPDLNWTDNPSDVGPDQPYEFVAIRKKKFDSVSGQMKWGPFSTPALWGFWGTTTVYQPSSTYYKPYTCFAFVRTNLPNFISYTVKNIWEQQNKTYAQWIAETPTNESEYYENPLSFIVTVDTNNQVVSSNTITWTDTVPAPPGQLYMITNHIGDEGSGSDSGWTSPRAWGDAAGFQVEYAVSDENTTDNVYGRVVGYTLPKLDNYDLDNYPNLNDPDNDGIDEAAWRAAVANAGLGTWGDESDITDPDYMATCYKKVDGVWSDWQISRIKGEKGDPSNVPGPQGNDGTDIEFIYYRSKTESARPDIHASNYKVGNTTGSNGYINVDDALPAVTGVANADLDNGEYWHDNPSGVTSTWKCEWVSSRRSYYSNGVKCWDAFYTPPTLWSKYGENGQDGDGVQYIFMLTSDFPHTFSGNDDPYNWNTTTAAYQQKNAEYFIGSWTDDPSGVNTNTPYEWVSMRKYTHSGGWGQYTHPALWATFAETAQQKTVVTLDFDNSEQPVAVSEQNKVLVGTNTISLNTELFSELMTDDGTLLDWGEVYLGTMNNGTVTFGNTPDVTFQNYTPTISNNSNMDGTITRSVLWASGDQNRHYQLRVGVSFPADYTLSTAYIIPVKIKDISGVYYGIDFLKFNPVYSEKIVTCNHLAQVEAIKKASIDATTYSPGSIGQIASTPDDTFDTVSAVSFSYSYDNSNEVIFDAPVFNKASVIQAKRATFYYDATGHEIVSSNGAFATVNLFNADDNQQEWDDWIISIHITINGLDIRDKIVIGVGYNGVITDRETSYIIYPGKDGTDGDDGVNGKYKKELYCLGGESTYVGVWQASYATTGATIATLTGDANNPWSETKPTVSSQYPHIWMTRADVTIGAEATQVCVWEAPTRITPIDGTVTHQYQYLDGQVIRLSDWSTATSGRNYWNGGTRVGDNNSATGDNTGTYYLDIVSYNGDYYKCVSNTTKGNTTPNNDIDPTTGHWELFSFTSSGAFDTLLSNSAYIDSLTAKQVVVTDGNNTVQGGMTSGKAISTTLEGGNTYNKSQVQVGDVRIWAGPSDPNGSLTSAPFTVYDDGKVISQGVISGTNPPQGIRTVMDKGMFSIELYSGGRWQKKADFGYLSGDIVLNFYEVDPNDSTNDRVLYNLGPSGIQQFNSFVILPEYNPVRFWWFNTGFSASDSYVQANGTDSILYQYTDGRRQSVLGGTATEYYDPIRRDYYSTHSDYNGKYYYNTQFLYPADGYYVIDSTKWIRRGINNDEATCVILHVYTSNGTRICEKGQLKLNNVDQNAGTTGTVESVGSWEQY